MNAIAIIIEIIRRIESSQNIPVLISNDELLTWPVDGVISLKTQKILTKSTPARSIVCPGCEQQCTMPIKVTTTKETNISEVKSNIFIVCDKQINIGNVPISESSLLQWQVSYNALAKFVINSLEISRDTINWSKNKVLELGLFKGKKHAQMIGLALGDKLELIAGNNKLRLADIIVFNEANNYHLDIDALQKFVDGSTIADPSYIPASVKCEIRRQGTADRNQAWNIKYQQQQKQHPYKSKKWHANKISKDEFGNHNKAATILRQLK